MPGNAGGGWGDGLGDAVTDMSSSWGEWGDSPFEKRLICTFGDDFGEDVLWSVLQLTDMGPGVVEEGSKKS